MIGSARVSFARFTERRRSLRLRWLALGGVVLAGAIVLAALPGRRVGSRSATDAYVPLRPMTAAEAAFLLSHVDPNETDTVVLRAEGDDLILATRQYVLPWKDGPDLADPPSPPGFRAESANWSHRSSVYRIPRLALEQALGRPIAETEFSPGFIVGRPVSFSPERVWFYAAVEIGFLGAWFALLGWFLSRIRRPTLLLPGLLLFLAAPLLFVRWYSPAFFDADFFHQRIILDDLALSGLWAAFVLFLPAAVSLAAWVILRASEGLARRHEASPDLYRRRVATLLIVLLLGFLAARAGRYFERRSACSANLAVVKSRVTGSPWLASILAVSARLPRNVNLVELSTESAVQEAIGRVLNPAGEDPALETTLLVPGTGPDGEHLFLWRRGFLYADFRPLDADYTGVIEGAIAGRARDQGESASTLREDVFGARMCGQRFAVEGHDVVLTLAAADTRRAFDIRWW